VSACPFVPLCQRDFTGPELAVDELERLQGHLSEGCAECEQVIEDQLSGSGEGELATVQHELTEQLSGALAHAEAAMAPVQTAVLARVQDRIKDGDLLRQRRLRRRALRAVFYVVNLAALFMLTMAYVGTVVAAKYVQREGQALTTRTELQAMIAALHRYEDERGELPPDSRSLVEALQQTRLDREGIPHFPFEPSRLGPDGYLDDFGHPYRYDPIGSRAVIYSVGPNGRDDDAEQDDLAEWIHFAR
jgi:hypothetical protein